MAPTGLPRRNLAKTKGEEEGNWGFFSPEPMLFPALQGPWEICSSARFLVSTRETQEILSGCKQGVGGEAMNCFNMKFTFKIDPTEPNTGGWWILPFQK